MRLAASAGVRCLHPVGLDAAVGDVEVGQQDLVFRVLLLKADRVLHLLELAPDGHFFRVGDRGSLLLGIPDVLGLRQKDVPHELHGQGRTTARVAELTADDRADSGPHQRGQVDAAVFVEALVFARDCGVLEVGGDFVPLEVDAILRVDGGEGDLLAALLRVEGVALLKLPDRDVLGEALEDADRARSGDT